MLGYTDTLEKLCLNINTVQSVVISNPIKKGVLPAKVKFEPVNIKDKRCWQMEYIVDNKAMHKNIEGNIRKLFENVLDKLQEGYKQCNIVGNNELTVLMNKKKQFTITGVKANDNCCVEPAKHNKEKNYILKDGEFVEWLYELGVMDKNGKVHNKMQKKFRQINRFVEMLSDVEKNIPNDSVIIDMGCGKSYLSFAAYHYFNEIKHKNITIRGYDLKRDVVENCNRLSERFGFDRLKFYCEDVANIENEDKSIAMIITLHACDTATDYAIYHGIRWGCRVIMNVPCCQHELFHQMKNDDMGIMLRYGIIKERFSALMTDAIRAEILRLCGYKADIMEFIDMEHTPKNIMIRSVYTGRKSNDKTELDRLIKEYNIMPTLYKLIFEND